MIVRKKNPFEQIDDMLLEDFREIRRGLETVDRMMVEDAKEIAKRWGHPLEYNDAFHRKKRESMRRLRSSR